MFSFGLLPNFLLLCIDCYLSTLFTRYVFSILLDSGGIYSRCFLRISASLLATLMPLSLCFHPSSCRWSPLSCCTCIFFAINKKPPPPPCSFYSVPSYFSLSCVLSNVASYVLTPFFRWLLRLLTCSAIFLSCLGFISVSGSVFVGLLYFTIFLPHALWATYRFLPLLTPFNLGLRLYSAPLLAIHTLHPSILTHADTLYVSVLCHSFLAFGLSVTRNCSPSPTTFPSTKLHSPTSSHFIVNSILVMSLSTRT